MSNHPILMAHVVTETTVSYAHGLASLAGVLRACGTPTDDLILCVVRDDDMQNAAVEMLCRDPSMILVSAMSNQWERVARLATCLKREGADVPLCIGGSHVSASPQCGMSSS